MKVQAINTNNYQQNKPRHVGWVKPNNNGLDFILKKIGKEY